MKSIKQTIIGLSEFLSKTKYEIGFIFSEPKNVLENTSALNVRFLRHHYHDRWFADPFILHVDKDSVVLLVEEFLYNKTKGRIARLTIDRHTCKLRRNEVVLELNSHLSFPFILRENDSIFICPENSGAGVWNKYEYDPVTNSVTRCFPLIPLPLTDAVFDKDGRVFSTQLPFPNGSSLNVFEFFPPDYKETSTVEFRERVARNAGGFFRIDDRWFRPAQECNDHYGHAVVFQEVLFENGSWTFKEIRRLTSPHPTLDCGCHTFNTFHDISVIDVYGYRRPRIRRLFVGALNLLMKVKSR